MHPSEVEYGVAPIASTDTAEAVSIDVGLLLEFVHGGEVVLDVLPRVVATDLLVPRLAEAGDTMAVRRNDDVALLCH